MRRLLITLSAVAVFAGAPTLAGEEQQAFDGMGSLMLAHEAEEDRESLTFASRPRYEQEAQCEEKEAELRARLEDLQLDLVEGVSFSASTLEEMSLTALDLAEIKVEQVIGHMGLQRGEELDELRRKLEDHRSEIEQHRDALQSADDQDLISMVQDALSKAQEALATN